METLATTYDAGMKTFVGWDAKQIANAVEEALSDFDNLAQLSFDAASRWRKANGVEHFIDRLFDLTPLQHKKRVSSRRSIGDRIRSLELDLFFAVTQTAMTSARAVLLAYRRVFTKRLIVF